MHTTPGAPAPPTPDRHAAAIHLAAHIVSENPGRTPASLAATVEALWSPNMWRVCGDDVGIGTPDTATQALTVAILRGRSDAVTLADPSIVTTALIVYGELLEGRCGDGTDLLDRVRAELAHLYAVQGLDRHGRPVRAEAA